MAFLSGRRFPGNDRCRWPAGRPGRAIHCKDCKNCKDSNEIFSATLFSDLITEVRRPADALPLTAGWQLFECCTAELLKTSVQQNTWVK